MKLYRFSPIKNERELLKTIKHIHFSSHKLCKQSFGKYFPNSGNVGVFCHYEKEYEFLTKLRQKLTIATDNVNQKYYRLHKPIVISAKRNIPKTTYYYLYIRKPDPYRSQVGDVDFFIKLEDYAKLKKEMLSGKKVKGARVFDRTDLDMIELYDFDIDVLAYVSTHNMTERVRVKQT